MDSEPRAPFASRGRYLLAAALVVVALTFARTLSFGFVNWDDDLHVTANPAVVGSAPLKDRLLTPSLGYPIPVTVATYALEHAAFGLQPLSFHATNLLIHLSACALLWLLARRMGIGPIGAAVAALLFGLHPVVAEPVSWVSGRKDLLATALALAATVFYWRSESEGSAGRSRAAALAAVALFALAALSKPVVLALPVAWMFASRERGEGGKLGKVRRQGWSTALRSAAPALGVALIVAVAGLVGQSRVGAVHTSSLWAWLRDIWFALGYHLGLLTFVQVPLAKHIPSSMPPPFDLRVDLLPVVALVAVALVVRRQPERPRRVAVFGCLWAAAAYLPNSNVLPLTRFLADSYLYLPLAGVALTVGATLEPVLARVRRRFIAVGLVALAVGALAIGSLDASLSWRDGVALWSEVHKAYPDSPEVCQNLGNAWFARGELPAALERYQACARRFGPNAFLRNIGITLMGLGRREEARQVFLALRERIPSDAVASEYLQRIELERRSTKPQ